MIQFFNNRDQEIIFLLLFSSLYFYFTKQVYKCLGELRCSIGAPVPWLHYILRFQEQHFFNKQFDIVL